MHIGCSLDYNSSFDSLNDIPEGVRDILRDIDVYSPQGSVRLLFGQLDFNTFAHNIPQT